MEMAYTAAHLNAVTVQHYSMVSFFLHLLELWFPPVPPWRHLGVKQVYKPTEEEEEE